MGNETTVVELRALANLINDSVEKIEAACKAGPKSYPLLDDSFTPDSEAIRKDPTVAAEGDIIVAAATQLIAAVRPPSVSLTVHALQYHLSTCLCVAAQSHVAEVLREGDPQGVHVTDIAARNGVDANKLGRILRTLATHHIFQEVTPDVFCHNRLSSMLDTRKSVAEILANPESKYDYSSGFAAFIEHLSDEGFKASAYLPEVLADPLLTHSGDPGKTAFSRAYNTGLTAFEWLELPENAYKRKRFGLAMKGVQKGAPLNSAVEKEYIGWRDLPAESVVVDVGGGIGSQTFVFARVFQHLKFVVQDLLGVIQNASKFWNDNMPDAISSGRVTLQGNDFFAEQPVQQPAIFFMRFIMHDWADENCKKILSHLRVAAGPDTQLVIVDNIMSYACPDTDTTILDNTVPRPPAPLLANKGGANVVPYLGDIQMLAGLNGGERTLKQWQRLLEDSQWRLTSASIADSRIIAVPA